MANVTNREKLWVLDTPAIITTDRARIKTLRWYSKAAAAGDDISIEDVNGNKVWESVATGPNYVEVHDFGPNGQDFDGFELAVIDSGTLYVNYV